MTIFAISYRFQQDATSDARRDSLRRALARCARVWSDGSIALVETAEPLAALEARLYLDSELNAVKDRLLVIEVAASAPAAARGALADREGLRALLPGVAIA